MNVIGKRLLSWLMVVTMVLSMVPVLDLSNIAVETKAADVYGQAYLNNVDQDILDKMEAGNAIDNSDAAFQEHLENGTCPICGDGVTWEPVSGSKNYAATSDLSLHFYYEDSVTTSTGNMVGLYINNAGEVSSNNTVCVWLKSTNNIKNTSQRCVLIEGTDNTVNFFGKGTITTDVDDKTKGGNMFYIGGKNAELNLYGGNFVYKHPGVDFQKAAIRVDSATATVNIFEGAAVGPAQLDTSWVTMNVQYTKGGTVNMFGGKIRNGVSPAWGYSGNVNIASEGTFNMYGGTISGGTFLTSKVAKVHDDATLGGNVMVGGKNQQAFYNTDGSDNTNTSKGTFNMYGGTITGGKANNSGNGGGNINIYNGTSVANLLGGTIENGYAKAVGGNIQCAGGTTTIGGTVLIKNGEAAHQSTGGGNVMVTNRATLKMEGGKLEGGTAVNGGAIYSEGSVTVSGGIISGGTATKAGGAIYNNGASLTISGGTVTGGTATNGGAIYSKDGSVNVSGGTIQNGIATNYGGNINLYGATLTVGKDATIQNGQAARGENIYAELNGSAGSITTSGKILGGTGANYGGSIASTAVPLTVNGGEISGGTASVQGGNIRGTNVTINGGTISGGKASSGGNIFVPGGTLTVNGGTIQNGEATDLGGNIYLDSATLTVGANATITGGKATNQGGNIFANRSGSTGEIVTSGTITNGNAKYGGNIILQSDVPLTVNGGEISGGKAGSWGGNIRGTNITVNDGKITGGEATHGGGIYVNGGGELKVTGGTLTGGTATTLGGTIYTVGGTVTISGDTIINGGTAPSGGAIYAQEATVNVISGTIQNGVATTGDGGGNINALDTALTIGKDATVTGGSAGAGGNIWASINKGTPVASVTVSGKITNGTATGGDGGNLVLHSTVPLTINDGEISGGTAKRWGGNIRANNITINGGLIYGGTAGDTKGSGNIMCYSSESLTINGGVIVGDTYIRAVNKLVLSGAPQIVTRYTLADTTVVTPAGGTGLRIPDGLKLDVSELTTDAKIAVTANEGQIITGVVENAADIAVCFTNTEPGLGVRANTSKELYVVSLPAAIVDKDGNVIGQYASNEEALANYDISSGKYISLSGDAVINEDVILVPSGDVKLSGEGKVTLIDPENKDFQSTSGTVTMSGNVEFASLDNTVDGDRYITVLSGNKFSAHYIEMQLTHVTLRTDYTQKKGPGLYYKASYKCDAILRDRVTGYGVAVSLINMPGDDFLTDNETMNTTFSNEDFVGAYENYSVAVNTGSVFDILNEDNSKEENSANAKREIYANVYLAIDVDGNNNPVNTLYVMGEAEENWDTKNGTAFSMFTALEGINSNWSAYSDAQKTVVKNFIEKMEQDYITADAYAELESLLTNIL